MMLAGQGSSNLRSTGNGSGFAAVAAGLLVAILASGEALAVQPTPYVIDDKGITVDWSRHRVRFAGLYLAGSQGESQAVGGQEGQALAPDSAKATGLAGLDRKARFAGYKDLYRSRLGQHLLGAMSRNDIRRLVRSSSTEYFSGGEVVVNMRMNLARALASYYENSPSVRAHSPSGRGIPMPSGQAMAVPKGKAAVILVADPMTPASTFMLKDENGAIRHSVSQMAPAAFRKNLMASWYRYPAGQYGEVLAKLKENRQLKIVEGRVGRGAIVVRAADFPAKALKPYLVNGKVDILIPVGR